MNSDITSIIINKFSEKFSQAYKELRGSGKSEILKYSPLIFKRWYYSALINETTLSPSFIYGSCTSTRGGVLAPSVRPQSKGSALKGFVASENNYTVQNHPVVRDLLSLVSYCTPDVELDEKDCIAQPLSGEISGFLSLADPYYTEYLTAIAFTLGLLKKSDAIYSSRAVISNNYKSFKALNQEEALKKIVKASIKVCSRNINKALPTPVSLVSEKGIEELIKKPLAIDDIFKKIFMQFGIDIERVWESYDDLNDSFLPEENSIMSSTFLLGVVLDKWFITPFGEYLKVIEPVYCFCYKFDEELEYLHDTLKAGGNVDIALFSPCAFYSFTPFGRIIFSYERAEERSYSPMPVSALLGILDMKADNEGGAIEGCEAPKEVYTFKVFPANDKRCWNYIVVADYNTLHQLHVEISLNFGFDISGYKFFTDKSMNLFSEIASPGSGKKRRKADAVRIDELDLTKGSTLVYLTAQGMPVHIELMKKASSGKISSYPKTVRAGKRFKDMIYQY